MADGVVASLFRGLVAIYSIGLLVSYNSPQAHGMAWMIVPKIDIVRCFFMVC